MRHDHRFIAAVATVVASLAAAASGSTYYVATNGNDSNDGSIASPFATFTKAITVATAGDTIYARGGTYSLNSRIRITKGGAQGSPINLWAYPGETPILDFSANPSTTDRGIQLERDWWHFKGLTIQKAPDNGIWTSGSNSIFENLTLRWNKDSGLQLSGDTTRRPSNNLILNTDSYENYDPLYHGENADGFAAKFAYLGAGNVFRGNRAWGNSDDGWDFWQAANGVRVENSWAFGNGFNIWGDTSFQGDGNGFKLGQLSGAHVLNNDVAWGNAHNGIDVNANGTGVRVNNSASYANGERNWQFDENLAAHVLRNNVSFAGAQADNIYAAVDDAYNTWNGIPVDAADFVSLVDTIARGPRLADGSLPISGFLRLIAGSNLIDAGINVGLPYTGIAPDLGAFEVGIPLPGDADLDGKVDITDLGILATNWQLAATWTGGDFNFDGLVDITDLGLLATNWQTGLGGPLPEALASLGLPSVSAPEPAAAASSGVAALLLLLPRGSRRVGKKVAKTDNR